MNRPLDLITINGFKSILSLPGFQLGALNMLVGANGAGKSNFIDFFRMLRAMAEGNMRAFITQQGGRMVLSMADRNGRGKSKRNWDLRRTHIGSFLNRPPPGK